MDMIENVAAVETQDTLAPAVEAVEAAAPVPEATAAPAPFPAAAEPPKRTRTRTRRTVAPAAPVAASALAAAPAAVSAPPAGTITPGAPNSALKEPAPAPEDGVNPNHPAAAHVQILDVETARVLTDRRKFAICGFASSTRGQVPINDPSWEIWGMNQLYRHIPRADRWFDLHWNWNSELVPGTDHEGWIRDSGIPVYMTKHHDQLPTSVRFPLETLMAHFGGIDYFTSSVAHMMALAIYEIDLNVEARLRLEPVTTAADGLRRARELYAEYTIGLFGIDLVVGEEYFWQKACAEFWIGTAALGRGIEVYVPPQSALCKQLFRYGYQTEPESVIKPAEIRAHIAAISKEREEVMKRLYMLDGALQVDEHWAEVIDLRLRGANIKLTV